jgi:NAD(P)-dependent dehydrogenase (short-subunit alcohol dehydrogenase family)
MTTLTFLVTGSTDGIGFSTAQALGNRGARVLVHGRTQAKAEAAVQALREGQPTGHFSAVHGDLSSFASIRALAQQVDTHQLDGLINNAGVFMNQRVLSVDGHELTFQVNHLAPFLLTWLLRERLIAAPQGRVVTVSSVAHARGRVDLTDLDGARQFAPYPAYAASKLLNVHFTHELARRLAGTRVTATALHPGVIGTKLLKAGFNMSGASTEHGARTSVTCALSPELAQVTGKYFSDEREVACAPHANNPALEGELWQLSERLTSARW